MILLIIKLKSIAFISVLTLLYLAAFLMTANILIVIIAQSWCLFVGLILQPSDFSESTFAGQAFFSFGILIILLLSLFSELLPEAQKMLSIVLRLRQGGESRLHHLKKTQEIGCSEFYLKQFEKAEDAVKWWFLVRFYLALLSGLFFLIFSIKSLINICSIDAILLIIPDPDIYVGKYFGQAKILLINNLATTLGLSLISYIFIRFAGKHKDLHFLQAILLVSVAAFLIAINGLGYLQITMTAFINSFLLTSILACLISLTSTAALLIRQSFFGIKAPNFYNSKSFLINFLKLSFADCGRGTFSILQYLRSIGRVLFKKVLITDTFENYQRSFLIFLTSSNLLHWSVLFNYSLEHENLKISNWFHVLLVCFWCYLAFRFLRLSASYGEKGYIGQKEHPVSVPIAPVLVYSIYLSPVFKIFFLSWNLCFDLKKSSFYSFFTALLSPTIGLKPTLNSAETGLVVTIASPSETKGWLDFFGAFMPILTPALELANKRIFRQEITKEQSVVEGLVAPAERILNSKRPMDPQIREELMAGLRPIHTLQSPVLSDEQRATLLTESVSHFSAANNLIKKYCPTCPVSPTTCIVRKDKFQECMGNFAKDLEETTSAATSLAASVADALEKVAS